MTMNTNRYFAHKFAGKTISRFSTDPSQFIGIYLKKKFADVALQDAALGHKKQAQSHMICKWVCNPETGNMECFWQKTHYNA